MTPLPKPSRQGEMEARALAGVCLSIDSQLPSAKVGYVRRVRIAGRVSSTRQENAYKTYCSSGIGRRSQKSSPVVLSLSQHGYGEIYVSGSTWLVHGRTACFWVPVAGTIMLVSALDSPPSYRTDGKGEFHNLVSVIL